MYSTCNIDTDKIHASYTRLNHNHSQFATGLEIHSYNVENDMIYLICAVTIGPPCGKAQCSDYDQD